MDTLVRDLYYCQTKNLCLNGFSGPEMLFFLHFEDFLTLVAQKITPIGLNFAEIGFLGGHTNQNCDSVRFHSLQIDFFGWNFSELISLKMTTFIRNDSDSFITLTIMWGSFGRIEKLLPLVKQWPTRDSTPLHSAALRSAPFRHLWVIVSLVVIIFQFSLTHLT